MFDVNGFMRAELKHRTEAVPVPAMKSFFPEDATPEIVVRGMSATEIAKANEAEARNSMLSAMAKAMVKPGKGSKEQVDQIRAAIGLAGEVPGELAKRIEMLTMCSVSPELPQNAVVKLAEKFPVEFYALTNKITELSGQGAEVVSGKSPPSGKNQKSEKA